MYDFLHMTSNFIGLFGAFLLLLAFFLLSTNRISSHSLKYQIYNLLAASLILYSLLFDFNLSAFVIEIAWIIISLMGIYKILSARKHQS